MSEEEIKEWLEKEIELQKEILKDADDLFMIREDEEKRLQALEGILDLYNKEKEKNASQEKEIKLMKSININDNYISKDKIRKEKEDIEEMLLKEKTQITKMELSYAIGVLEELLEE